MSEESKCDINFSLLMCLLEITPNRKLSKFETGVNFIIRINKDS